MVKPSMLDTIINKLTPHYQNLKYSTVFLILFAVSLFVRLPFFFRDYIDRDESTFILMAQSWVDGHLPYTELWDLKPPITFLFFACIIYIFGKSFLVIRLVGTLIVAITAFYTYKISLTATTKKVSFWAAIGCVALQSMFGSLQGVMSEHICMVFFIPALYILIKKTNAFWYALAGFLMGLSIMTKLNLAYVVLVLGIYIFFIHVKKRAYGEGALKSALFGIGVITVIFLTFLPYYLNNYPEIWWKSVILASLEYAGARRYSFWKMAPTFLPIIAFLVFTWRKKLIPFDNPKIQLLLVAIIGVLVSFIKGGRINSHYLIQLYPLLIILVGITLAQIYILKKLNPKIFLWVLLALPMESYLEYYAIIKNKLERGTFYNGEGINVPQFLKENNLETKNVFFTEYHIGYWVLGTTPPTKAATHPSNIGKPEMFPFYDNPRKTFMSELNYILDTVKPKIIVVRNNRSIFDLVNVIPNSYINAYLAMYYSKISDVDGAGIYQRL